MPMDLRCPSTKLLHYPTVIVRFSRVWRAVLRMGHPQGRWSVRLMPQHEGMPSQFQGELKISGLYHEMRWNVRLSTQSDRANEVLSHVPSCGSNLILSPSRLPATIETVHRP